MSAAPNKDDPSRSDKEATGEGALIADRYELVSQVGVGGMGVVWRARDRKLGRAVAVKVLSGASVGNEIARTRLIREARAAAALEHDGIIRVYDVGETDDGGAFLVMELIRGRSLRYVIEDKSMKLGTVAQVIVQAGRALQFAHDAGIVHRDMKPDNIMIREDGRVTVVDFGVAKPIATDLMVIAGTVAGTPAGGALTGSGQLVGTPAYLAPEQARGLPVGPATDQFALAVTAYEAFTGARPWTGSCFSEVIASLLRDAPVPVSSMADVPKAVDDVLLRALSKDPTQRFADIGELADALEDAAKGLELDPVASTRGYSRRSNAITHPDPPQVPVPAALTPPAAPITPASAEPSPVDGVPITTTGKMSVEMTRASAEEKAAGKHKDPHQDPLLVTTGDALRDEQASQKQMRKASFFAGGAIALIGIVAWMWSSVHRDPVAPTISTSSPPSVVVTAPTLSVPADNGPAAPVETTPKVEPTAPASAETAAPTAKAATPPVKATASQKPPVIAVTASAAPKASAVSSAAKTPAVTAPEPSTTSTGRRIRTDL